MHSLPQALTHQALSHELGVAISLAQQAGALLLRHLQAGFVVEHKTSAEDPVTIADREASALIMAGLAAAFPHDGLLSEEEEDGAARLSCQRVWIIDPIDGTREFTVGDPDFCVSIGLCIGGEPVLGVIYAPVNQELWYGVVGGGVWKNDVPVGLSTGNQYLVSVSDTEHRLELEALGQPWMKPSGSTALKLARLASGEADATFTMSPRSEWDLAGGHALLRAVGGELQRRDGRPVRYNQAQPYIEQGFIAGRPEVLVWLKEQLQNLAVPCVHLGLTPADPAWGVLEQAVLPQGGQIHLAGQAGICVRYGGGQLLALMHIDPVSGAVISVTGDAFHLNRLGKAVVRAVGLLGA